MIFVYYVLAVVLVLFSYRSFRGGIAYLTFFRKEISRSVEVSHLFATVIVPCRGIDQGLESNLRPLTGQDLSNYEVIFVVDDKNDPAVSVIERLMNEAACQTKLVIAPNATASSQKVENLREAVLHADARSEVFAFVDSDARPSKDWLRQLIAPLNDSSIGATTGYRWFISENPTFASEMLSAWNASIASALGPSLNSNFCWGGSMAMRRNTFEQIGMRDLWKGTLSDDFAVTRAMRAAGRKIVFVPQNITASVENCSLSQLFEFTTRQMKITRVYATDLWLVSFLGSGLFIAVMTSAMAIILFSRQNGFAVYFSISVLLFVSAFSTAKSWLRLKAVKLVLPQYQKELSKQAWTQNTLWLLAPFLFFFNSLCALVSRKITWRGTRYELKSPVETVIIPV